MIKKNLKRLFFVQILLLSVAVNAKLTLPPPPPPPADGPTTESGDIGTPVDGPIDMHTSALLVVGIGMIASYAYFARRKQVIK